MNRKTPLKRTPFRKSKIIRCREEGKFSGKVRLYGMDLQRLRLDVYYRAQAFCEVKHPGCEGVIGWEYGHMHHKRHRSLGGSDSLENCVWSCPSCHRKEHNQ